MQPPLPNRVLPGMALGRISVFVLAVGLAGLPACGQAQALVSQDNTQAALDCRGQTAIVHGSGNRLSFAGPCRGLVVRGSFNAISLALAPGATVTVRGDGNRIDYPAQDGVPHSLVNGRDDSIVPTVPAVQVQPEAVMPAPLLVAGPPYDVQCAGRDVIVQGSGLSPVLLGGCRSLTVEGSSDMITAELLPGASIAVGGAAVIVNYVLVGNGPPPVVRTTVRGLAAKQIQHFGAIPLALPTLAAGQ
jgi:hypothetical protein